LFLPLHITLKGAIAAKAHADIAPTISKKVEAFFA
jgi:hypothetical protein